MKNRQHPTPKLRPSTTGATSHRKHESTNNLHLPSTERQTNLFNGIYKGNKIVPGEPSQSKLIIYRGSSVDLEKLIKNKSQSFVKGKSSKTVQELLQENIYIKGLNNKLRDELMILRGQANARSTRNPSAQKPTDPSKQPLEIPYEKDIYWLNNEKSHRLAGIKTQYEKLKAQYHKNKAELKDIKMRMASQGVTELEVYVRELEGHNRMLIQYVKGLNAGNNNREDKDEKAVKSARQTTQNKSTVLQVISKLQQQLSQLQQKTKQKDTKLIFLQRALIGKDNAEHNANRKARKLKKQNEEILAQYNKLKEEMEVLRSRLQIQKIKMKAYFGEEIQQVRRDGLRMAAERDRRIKELESAVRNMEAMTGNRSKLSMTKSALGQARNPRKASHDFHNLNLLIRQQDEQDFSLTQSRRYASHPHHENSSNFNSQNSQILSKPDIRQPKRANKRHSEDSKKMRKVEFHDIQPLGELLRYRMIGQRIAVGHIKDYFVRRDFYTEESQREKSHKSESFFQVMEKVQKQEQKQWQDEYITMREVIKILSQAPFSLNPQQSLLLARYLIEDCQDDYIYSSQQNQNKRQILKSIIKTIIGPYTLPSQAQVQSLQKTLAKYSTNLKSTLNSYYPNGLVSKNKLIEVVVSIGMEPSEGEREMLVGRAALGSEGLGELRYAGIFQL